MAGDGALIYWLTQIMTETPDGHHYAGDGRGAIEDTAHSRAGDSPTSLLHEKVCVTSIAHERKKNNTTITIAITLFRLESKLIM